MTSSTHIRCMNNITGMDITNSVYACSFGLREIVVEICSFFHSGRAGGGCNNSWHNSAGFV